MDIMVLQHEECEHLGYFNEILNRTKISYQYVKLYEKEDIPNLKRYNAIIILGGPMNVYEENKYPFLKKENNVVKEALKIKKPMLGLCLGAQIITKAAGAKVYPAKRREIGWFTIDLTKDGKDDNIFRNLEKQFTVFQWHQDTFDIPINAKKLATSNIIPNQAFSIGRSAYAIQFHLEITKQMILDWIDHYNDEIVSFKEVDKDKIIKNSEHYISSLNNYASLFLSNFLSFME